MASSHIRDPYKVRALIERMARRGLVEKLRSVCLAYNVTLEDVLSRQRYGRIVRARDACCVKLLAVPMSGPEVGVLMGMDHTSVFAARNRYKLRDNGRLV